MDMSGISYDPEKTKSCPPAIAVGCEPSIGVKLSHHEALLEWKRVNGPGPKHEPKMKGKAGAPKGPRTPVSQIMYTFTGAANHRRPGSLGAAFVDFLIANPGATEELIKGAGHDLKHLRWDLETNPKLFSAEKPKG